MLYESAAFLFLIFQKRLIKFTGLFLLAFSLFIKISIFFFYLSFGLLLTFFWVKVLLFLSGLLFAIVIIHAIDYGRVLIYKFILVLFALASLLFTDKIIANDKLASSFSSHAMITLSSAVKSEKSGNIIYKLSRENLEKGAGVVLIVWESLGISDSDILRKYVAEKSNQKVREISWEGGSTVPAEIRYLCGSNNGFYASECLGRFASYSIAYHGNSLSYFNRNQAYLDYGFMDIFGRSQLIELGYADCSYAYNAICDDSLLDALFSKVQENKCRGLFYALTIDSHYPYRKYTNHDLQMYEEVSRLADRAKKLKATFENCHIYIVGDHPPPLARNFSRDKIMFLEIE